MSGPLEQGDLQSCNLELRPVPRSRRASSSSGFVTPVVERAAKSASAKTNEVLEENPQAVSEGAVPSSDPVLTKYKERLYLAVVCWGVFTIGWNDGSIGPLLLRIQSVYAVSYAVVSLMFILQFVGYTSAGFLNITFNDKFGFGKILVFGATCQIIAYSIQSSAPPFAAFLIAYTINGFGCSLLAAQCNTFCASLPNSASNLGIMHAAYGLGATASPLAATQFAQQSHWSFQYLISLSVATSGLVVFFTIFRLRRQEDILGTSIESSPVQTQTDNKYRQIFKLKSVHLLSFFVLFYAGLEVTIGGWIVTYLVQVRGGGASTGYVSSGFFGGLTVGRIGLLWVNAKIGTRRVIFLYCVLCLALEFVVWFVPSLLADAISASVIGLLLGPWFPLVVGFSRQILPNSLLSGCIGWISAFGQAGSALFPFLTGALAQKFGVKALQPLLVSMMVACGSLWWLVPARQRHVD